jgi:hypothetical protein
MFPFMANRGGDCRLQTARGVEEEPIGAVYGSRAYQKERIATL